VWELSRKSARAHTHTHTHAHTLKHTGYIKGTQDFESAQIVEAIQELLVCVEMVVVSSLFHRSLLTI
jgi:predicted transcriptional regulator